MINANNINVFSKKRIKTVVTLLLVIAFVLSVTGCDNVATKASQEINPKETSVEYLTQDFSQKLKKDGAKIYTGEITKIEYGSGKTEKITFIKYDKDGGEKAKPQEFLMNSKVKIAYATNSNPNGIVMNSEEFAKNFVHDAEDLFEIYEVNDEIVLILSKKLK